jgi:uncharacterized repeat protein (TIGR03803 family)
MLTDKTNTHMKTILLSASLFSIINIVDVKAQEIWGMTKYGGTYEKGVIFKMDEDASNQEVVFSFEGIGRPEGGLTEFKRDEFYGMTAGGGEFNFGAIYRFESDKGAFIKIIDLNGLETGRYGYGRMILASNGLLYGMTARGGEYDMGVLFEFDPESGSFIKKIDFDGKGKGSEPLGSLIEADDGSLYGMTSMGGAFEAGVIFRFNPTTGEFKKLFDFDGDEYGSSPMGNLMQASNGYLFGMTRWGGEHDHGVIFRVHPESEVFAVVFEFDGDKTGRFPHGSLIEANGMLYGLTPYGGSFNGGVLFGFDSESGKYNLKYEFTGGVDSGSQPFGSLIQAGNGKLYGILQGYQEMELMFEFDPSADSYKRLPFQGIIPRENAVLMESISLASNGNIYFLVNGHTNDIKSINYLYEYNPDVEEITGGYTFNGIETGDFPTGSLVQGANDLLYGTTSTGGKFDMGVIFEYDPFLHTYKKIVDFERESKGGKPGEGMVLAQNLNLYGLTSEGGHYNKGVLYGLETGNGKFVKLFDFDGVNGEYPDGVMVSSGNGKLYGTTSSGGAGDSGVLFEFDPETGTFVKLLDFNLQETGREPYSHSLVAAANGFIYGTTHYGGFNDKGVLYQYNPESQDFEVMIHFGSDDSDRAPDNLSRGLDNFLYAFLGRGAFLRFDPETRMHSRIHTDVYLAGGLSGRLTQSSGGKLYGMDSGIIWYRATDFTGGIFEIDPENERSDWLLDFNGKNGSNPENTTLLQLKGATLPMAECMDAVIYLDETGHAALLPGDIDGGSTGTGLQFTVSKSDFTCADIGENDVVLTVVDNKGNTTTCSAKAVVADTLAPVAVCVDVEVYLDDSGSVTVDLESIGGGSFDACGIESVTADVTIFNCSNIGENLLELTVTDKNGNISSCLARVMVIDNRTPEMQCVYESEYHVLAGEDYYIVANNEADATASDNCNIVSLYYEIEGEETTGNSSLQGQQFVEGTHSVRWVATDSEGNQASCTGLIIIKKRPATISYSIEYGEQNGQIVVVGLLTDDLTGEGIAGKELEFIVDGIKDTVSTGNDGRAFLQLSLEAGRYPVQISFNGDKSYLESSYTTDVVTSARDIKILAEVRVYPNPFMQILNIEFVPAISGRVVIGMFDSGGRLVEVIFNGPVESGMYYRAKFLPRTSAGSHYYYRINLGGETINGKAIYNR